MSLISIVSVFVIGLLSMLIKSRYNYILFCLAFIVLVSLRDVSTPDTEGYAIFYESVTSSDLFSYNFSYEKGFVLLAIIIKLISSSTSFFFGTLTFINLSIIVYLFQRLSSIFNIQNRNTILIGLLSYCAFFGLYYNAIVLRAGLALSMILLYTSINSKKRRLMLLILAFLFHQTAIIFVIGIIIMSLKMSYRSYLIISCLVPFVHLLGGGYLFTSALLPYLTSMLYDLSGTYFSKLVFYTRDLAYLEHDISFRFLFYEVFCSLNHDFPVLALFLRIFF